MIEQKIRSTRSGRTSFADVTCRVCRAYGVPLTLDKLCRICYSQKDDVSKVFKPHPLPFELPDGGRTTNSRATYSKETTSQQRGEEHTQKETTS